MERFFFNLLGASRWADEDGEELPDLAAARCRAVERFARVAGMAPHLSVQVTGGDGRTLFTVPDGQPASGRHWLH